MAIRKGKDTAIPMTAGRAVAPPAGVDGFDGKVSIVDAAVRLNEVRIRLFVGKKHCAG